MILMSTSRTFFLKEDKQMYKIILTKKEPRYSEDALTFEFNESDKSDFLKLVESQGYYITYFEFEVGE